MKERLLEELAGRQHGIVTVGQCEEAGVGREMRARRVRQGHWERLSPTVYRLNGAPTTDRQRLLAGVLDVGDGAYATCEAAGALWGVPGCRWTRPQVLVKRGGDHVAHLAELHETSILDPHHVTFKDGVPVVTLARLCFETAARERAGRVARTVDNCINLGMKHADLERVVDDLAKRGRPGSKLMRKLVAERGDGYVAPASELEHRFFSFCDRFDLPAPRRQVDLGDASWTGRVDAYYDAAKVVVELDSRRHWMAVLEAESDRQRDNELMAAGWRVLRVTWRMLHDRPEEVANTIRRALLVTV